MGVPESGPPGVFNSQASAYSEFGNLSKLPFKRSYQLTGSRSFASGQLILAVWLSVFSVSPDFRGGVILVL